MPYIANPLEGIPLVNTFITDQSLLGTTPETDDKLIIFDESATALKQLTIAELQASVLVAPAFTGVPTAPTANAGTNTTQLATTAFVTTATTALNTIDEMTDTTISSVGANEVLKWSGSAWINQTLAEANILPVAGPTFTGVLTVGSAVLSEADLEQIDDLTAGTAVASKALVVDANKDIGTIRNLTIDGVFTDGNYTFATDGSVTGLGAITSTGVVTATGFTIGSAVIAEAELEMIDGITAGTAAASKALVLDGNKDIGTIRNLTIDGTFSDGNYTFDTSGNVTGLGTIAAGTTTIGSLVVAAASITDTSGAISFGNENLTTTGTLAAGTTTIGTLTVAAASITDSSGALSFGNENLTTTGTLSAGVITGTGFTIGSAVIIESELEMIDGITAGTAAASKALVLDASTNITGIGTISAGAITSSGIVTGTGFTAGSAVLAEAELELLDGLTAGTAIASKVVTTDASIDTTGQRNLTITGELDAATLDISGVADIAGAVDLHATLDMNTNDIDNARSITFIAEVDNGNSSTSDTIDWGAGQKQKTTMTGNCTYTFTAPDGPCNLVLSCYQDGTARTITWPATVKWPAATAPTFTGTNNIRDIIAFYYDGTHYFGQATLNFPA